MHASEQINILNNKIAQLELENKNLHETVAYLTKKLYGKSSETSKALGIKEQMSLFDEAETEADPAVLEPTLEQVYEARRKKYPGQRKDKLDKLPHDKIIFKLEPADLDCPQCGTELKPIGEEFVRTEVEYIPATLRVIDYYIETYKCERCKDTGHPYMEKTPLPYPVIPHSYASPTSVAHITYQKYVNAVPLYRQEADWKNLGLDLKRQTMSNWILEASREWLMPLINLLHNKLLKEKYIHADETKIQVLNEKGRKNTTDSFMWVYGTYKDSNTPIRIFEYHPTRNGDHAKEFLKGFHGYLISDAYQGYEKVDDITRCYCWSHLRRYFVDALPPDVNQPQATLPSQAIEYCKKLFKIEDEIEKLTPEEKKKQRQERSKPVLDAFWSWVENNKSNCLPKSKLAKAFGYALNQKEGLMNFLKDGNIAISNNLAENSIRPFTVGRRNWLFSGSPEGATASAAVYSIIETAKANGLNPYEYLRYIFKYLPGVRINEEPEFLEDFLPWNQDVQAFCNKAQK
ncbi:MAG TPA: IS66 family transposase [Clostridia bacterium]|nr:IS66 family transposase [Clostridia bacterium]